MFTFNKDVTATNCEPGVTRKILCYSDDLMMCEIHFEKGSKGNFHSHKHLQITYVAKGSFEFTIGDETKIVNQGDSVYMPSGPAARACSPRRTCRASGRRPWTYHRGAACSGRG